MHHILLCLFDEFIAKGGEICTKDSLLKGGENVENMINSENDSLLKWGEMWKI